MTESAFDDDSSPLQNVRRDINVIARSYAIIDIRSIRTKRNRVPSFTQARICAT